MITQTNDVCSEQDGICGKDRDQLLDIYVGMISSVGLTGREIARLSGTRPQYISDIKRKQRPLSREMFLRTLAGLFGEYKWLISGDLALDTRRIISLYPNISRADNPTKALPIFQRPFLGPNLATGDWDGSFFCVGAPVAENTKIMRNPYILHLPFNDRGGRLRKGDYLLVDQQASNEANYLLIKNGWGVKLVKRDVNGYEDVENAEQRFSLDTEIIGNVAMLLIGSL